MLQYKLNVRIKVVCALKYYNHYFFLRQAYAGVQMFFTGSETCYIPDLPTSIYGQNLVITSGDFQVLHCGGFNNTNYLRSCLALDVVAKKWVSHSHLTKYRYAATSVTMPNGVYILGGEDSPSTTDFLPKSSQEWIQGPIIPDDGLHQGCSVRISDTEFVLIGGYHTWDRVVKFNIETSEWIPMPNLKIGRRHHGCAMTGKNIIVTGLCHF